MTEPLQEITIGDRLICSFTSYNGFGLCQTSQIIRNGERVEARWGKYNALFKVKKWKKSLRTT